MEDSSVTAEQAALAQEVASLKDALENGIVLQISELQEQMKSLAAAVGDATAERSLSEQLVEQAARWISLNDELQRQRQELIPALQASRDDMYELHSKSEQMKTRLVAELQGLESAVSTFLDVAQTCFAKVVNTDFTVSSQLQSQTTELMRISQTLVEVEYRLNQEKQVTIKLENDMENLSSDVAIFQAEVSDLRESKVSSVIEVLAKLEHEQADNFVAHQFWVEQVSLLLDWKYSHEQLHSCSVVSSEQVVSISSHIVSMQNDQERDRAQVLLADVLGFCLLLRV